MLYEYFGFPISSNIELPELFPLKTESLSKVSFQLNPEEADSLTELDWFFEWKSDQGHVSISVAKTDDSYILQFPQLARFFLHHQGNKLSCLKHRNVPLTTVRHLLLDQVLPRFFFHFFNMNIVHASFIEVGGVGIAFLGETGWGKSTLAAGFINSGNTVLTDDCLLVTKENAQIYGIPSYATVRLFDDSLQVVQTLPNYHVNNISHYSEKKRILSKPVHNRKLQLKAAFFLNNPNDMPQEEIRIKPFQKLLAVTQLIRHSFSLDITDRNRQNNQLDQLSDMARHKVRFWQLEYPRTFIFLPTVIQQIVTTIEE